MVRRWPVWALTALSLVVLAAGLVATGGPAQGRAERRDQTRSMDLSGIQGLLVCKAHQDRRLGTDPTPTEACPMTPRLADPFTAAPYRIELIAPDTIRLCAAFELSPRGDDGSDESGCIIQQVTLP